MTLSLDEGHDNNKGKYDDGIFHDGGSGGGHGSHGDGHGGQGDGGGHDGGGGGHGDGGGDEDWMIGVERIRNCIILHLLTNVEMVMITITMMWRIANCENFNCIIMLLPLSRVAAYRAYDRIRWVAYGLLIG